MVHNIFYRLKEPAINLSAKYVTSVFFGNNRKNPVDKTMKTPELISFFLYGHVLEASNDRPIKRKVLRLGTLGTNKSLTFHIF